jgi:hypothetical protein
LSSGAAASLMRLVIRSVALTASNSALHSAQWPNSAEMSVSAWSKRSSIKRSFVSLQLCIKNSIQYSLAKLVSVSCASDSGESRARNFPIARHTPFFTVPVEQFIAFAISSYDIPS